MKHRYKYLAIAMSIIGFTSCSEESVIHEELLQETQLKSYSLTSSEDGSFLLEQNLSSGTNARVMSNDFGNEILLSEGFSNTDTKTTVLPLINNEIKIDFITENEIKIPGITILDELISSTTSSKKIDYVTNYAIHLLKDSSYRLDFSLAKNFIPKFTYNKKLNRHEIILMPKKTKIKNQYSKNFLKQEGEKLNIVFLRSIKTTSLSARRTTRYYPEPPEIIIK